MLVSDRLNVLNRRIHELVSKERDVSKWEFSEELHSLLSQRKNLVDQLVAATITKESIKTLVDYAEKQLR